MNLRHFFVKPSLKLVALLELQEALECLGCLMDDGATKVVGKSEVKEAMKNLGEILVC